MKLLSSVLVASSLLVFAASAFVAVPRCSTLEKATKAPLFMADAADPNGVPPSGGATTPDDATGGDAAARPAVAAAGAGESNQKLYGESLDLPNTYVKCGRCHTTYAIKAEDLGTRGKGRRLECTVCQHSWFQSRDRVMELKGGYEMIKLPQSHMDRIALNLQEGRAPNFMGEMKLYVGNISFNCREDDILKVFSDIGTVGDVSLVKDDQGRNRGFGFITMRKKEDGDKAIDQLDGTDFMGRNIAVRASTN